MLSLGRDAGSLRVALARFARPLVCECGAVEGAPGEGLVGALVRPLRDAAASVEAVCTRCAPDPRQLVSLGAIPPARPTRRPATATARPATAAAALTLAPSRATGEV